MPEKSPHRSSFGKSFARVGPRTDARGAAEHRRRLLERAHGAVIEIGAGYAASFAHYPPAVTAVLALEPDATFRELALSAASTAPVPVTVEDGVAESLPVADATVDVVVSSLVLCSVADPAVALAEVVRVLQPGGLLVAPSFPLSMPIWRGMQGNFRVVGAEAGAGGVRLSLARVGDPSFTGTAFADTGYGVVTEFSTPAQSLSIRDLGRLPG